MRRRLARTASRHLVELIALVALGATAPAIASKELLVANVPEPFEISGQMFPAGPIVVRHLGEYNPVTRIDRVQVGTDCVGLLLAVERSSGGGDLPAASLVFERASGGHLVLVGYTDGGVPASRMYLYQRRNPDAPRERAVLTVSR